MKQLKHTSITALSILGFYIFFPLSAFSHGDGENRVVIERETEAPIQSGEVDLAFELVDLVQKKGLKDVDLALTHEKKLHFFIFDPALIEFQHVHPEFINSKWHVRLQLPRNGDYWVYVQGRILDDELYEFTTSTRLKIAGGLAANPFPPTLSEMRFGNDGLSVVAISDEKIVAGSNTMLIATFSRSDGSKPEITPFLGALAHVIATPVDGDSLEHIHPMGMGLPDQVMLHVVFKEPGMYRTWVQFLDAGVLKTIPLTFEVKKK
ncbi:MAG: hypothetical protein AABZ55_15680 [Bdellovibrionota bacterium]